MMEKASDGIEVRGRSRLIIRDSKTGEVVEVTPWKSNLVTTAGKVLYAQLMKGDAVEHCTYCAVGSDFTPANVADTALGAEIGRLAITMSSRVGAVVTYSTFFGSGDGAGTWWEIGMLNDSTTGTLIARTVLGASKTKNAANTITCEYELSVV